MKIKFTILGLILMMIFSGYSINASTMEISSANELVNAFNSAKNNDIIKLKTDFNDDNNLTNKPIILDITNNDNRNIVIDGNGINIDSSITLNNAFMKINHNGTGLITIKNININLTNNKQFLFDVKGNNSGRVIFDNIEVTNYLFQIINIDGIEQLEVNNSSFLDGHNTVIVSTNTKLLINNTLIKNNDLSENYENGVLKIRNNTNLIIENSSFINLKKAKKTGYSGGAIMVDHASGIRGEINNSYFKSNLVTRNVGGAIAFYQVNNTIFKIHDCVFEDNKASGVDGISDGGAIALKNNFRTNNGEFEIYNNTFLSNIAYDNGGAMLIEAMNDGNTKASVYNNTFVNNKAYGFGDLNGVGGAIQTYGSPDTIISHNTFYNNINNGSGGGGAIGLSGEKGSTSAIVANNIFIDNTAPKVDITKQNIATDVSVVSNVNNNGNVGYDNGELFIKDDSYRNSLVTKDNVFTSFYDANDNIPSYARVGDAKPILIDYVGANNAQAQRFSYIPSPVIDEMLRTNSTRTITGITLDSRGYPRETLSSSNPYYPTAGAVEIYWTKFDVNIGDWSNYFLLKDEGGIKSLINNKVFYKVNNPPQYLNNAFVFEKNYTFTRNTLIAPDKMGFVGWQNKDKTSEIKDVNEVYEAHKQTYVALWKNNEYHLDFDLRGGIPKTNHEKDFNAQTIINGTNNNLAHKPNSIPIKNGYDFKGWYLFNDNTNNYEDFSNAILFDFTNMPINKDTTLYARWELSSDNPQDRIKYNITTEIINGKISDGASVDANSSFNVYFKGNNNYVLDKVLINNKEIELNLVSSIKGGNYDYLYNFSRINQDFHIKVIFKKINNLPSNEDNNKINKKNNNKQLNNTISTNINKTGNSNLYLVLIILLFNIGFIFITRKNNL
ncbi:MAG: InlB B-repeat-containing protein [Bacilli bacterium]|jgi:hypothetical protein|nr:InlB B-repeat-containing protein [Bacilli bacterium]